MAMRVGTRLSRHTGAAAAALACVLAPAAGAQEALEVIGAPRPGGTGFQPAVTANAEAIRGLENMILYIITGIVILVSLLILWTIIRYNRRANPTPARFTHNSPLEVTWTVAPIVVLVFIGAFSLPVLFQEQTMPEDPDVTINITGYQWHWGYEYPGEEISFRSFMLARDDLEEHGLTSAEYRLATDRAMVVPTGRTVLLNITAADVIHAWMVPAFGVKQDAVPGRTAQAWFRVEPGKEGIYFGQCNVLCGLNHAFMPIMVKAVTPEEYDAWLERTKTADARTGGNTRLAAAE